MNKKPNDTSKLHYIKSDFLVPTFTRQSIQRAAIYYFVIIINHNQNVVDSLVQVQVHLWPL